MRRGLPWLTLVCVCLLTVACGDDDDDKQADTTPDAEQQRTTDAGSHEERDSAVNGDSGQDAGSVPVDQSAPTGANGVAFDADGMLWLADLFGNQVLRIDPSTGEILERFPEEKAGPDDVVIDDQGRVFWTGWSSGRVGRIDPKTGEEVIIAELPAGANSIAFARDGRLFVGLVILNTGLYELDPEGSDEPRLITDAISSLNAFDFGPDGFLWGPLEDAVAKIDVETGEVIDRVLDGGFASVRYNERDGALYALGNGGDGAPPKLVQIDLEDSHMRPFAEPALESIDNFVIDPHGDFFVTGFNVPQLVVIGPDGTNAASLQIGELRK